MRSESVQNKQNKFWHRVGQVIRSVLFLLILAAVIGTAIRVVERKSSHQKYADFFDTADQLDVLHGFLSKSFEKRPPASAGGRAFRFVPYSSVICSAVSSSRSSAPAAGRLRTR